MNCLVFEEVIFKAAFLRAKMVMPLFLRFYFIKGFFNSSFEFYLLCLGLGLVDMKTEDSISGDMSCKVTSGTGHSLQQPETLMLQSVLQ